MKVHYTKLEKANLIDPIEVVCKQYYDGELLDGGRTRESLSKPPWYVIHLCGGTWDSKGWYFWVTYLGPPMIFLTRRRAEIKAKELREQYGGGPHYDNGPTKITVIKIDAP